MEYRKLGRFTNNVKVLQQELKSIKSQPLEGFIIEGKVIFSVRTYKWVSPLAYSKVKICWVTSPEDNEEDIFKWKIGVFGPPGTLYEGGYFKGEFD